MSVEERWLKATKAAAARCAWCGGFELEWLQLCAVRRKKKRRSKITRSARCRGSEREAARSFTCGESEEKGKGRQARDTQAKRRKEDEESSRDRANRRREAREARKIGRRIE
jgi:hypothetical protein